MRQRREYPNPNLPSKVELVLTSSWRDRLPWSKWRRLRRRDDHDEQRARSGPFPVYGVANWNGTAYLAGFGFKAGEELRSVTLAHGSGDDPIQVTVETTADEHPTHVELDADDGLGPIGTVWISVENQQHEFTRYTRDSQSDWAASGRVGELNIGIEATGISPEQLRLVVSDPRLYPSARSAP